MTSTPALQPTGAVAAVQFGRYESLFRINAGGMAEVFAARALGEGGFEKIVAVKRILPHLLQEERFLKMFLDEARVAACIESPHVVQTLDVGRDAHGAPYLAMELVVGLTLNELLSLCHRARRSVPLDVAVEVLAQAATGLEAAHEARTARDEPLSIVHRDISPQNVLIGADGRVRVSDFGIAQVSLGKLAQTEVGQVKGKFAYLSPEQSHGAPVDRRSDVFALGIVAWEAIAGRRLFASGSPFDTIEAVRQGPVPRLEEIRPEVPAALSAAIAKALARRVEDRWPTARAFGNALRAAVPGSGPEELAQFVSTLDSQRIEQMRQRIRSATTLKRNETLPDLSIDEGQTIDQLAEVGESVTRLIARRGKNDTTVSDAVANAETRLVAGARPAAETLRRSRVIAGAGIAIAIVALVVLALSTTRTSEPPQVVAAPPVAVVPEPAPIAVVAPPVFEPETEPVPEPVPAAVPIAEEVSEPRPAHREVRHPAAAPETPRVQRGALDLEAFDEAVGRSP